MFEIEVTNQQSRSVAEEDLILAARRVLEGEGIRRAKLSIAVVDDSTMQRLNRQFLDHDYPTDVLSFPLEHGDQYVEGEVIVCADVAAASSARFGWQADAELMLYVVHGVLHLIGYDDATDPERDQMRQLEKHYLSQFNLTPNYDDG